MYYKVADYDVMVLVPIGESFAYVCRKLTIVDDDVDSDSECSSLKPGTKAMSCKERRDEIKLRVSS